MPYDTFQHYEGLPPIDGTPINFVTKIFTLPSFAVKNTSDIAIMLVWITNCGIESTGWILILNKPAAHGMTYASYGGCQHTQSANEALSTLPSEWQPDAKGGGDVKIAVSTRHLFMYTTENSAYLWYITKKVFHGVVAGSVPLYVGDSVHLRHMAPPNSIIFADD